MFVFALGCLHGHGLPPVCGGERHRPLFFACRRTEYERRQRVENRRRRQRRRALWLAVHGVDVGPRVIHGMEVAA
ncbi:hypothetical protein ACIOWG_13070 [Streptomyces sp. NPDC087658]|uniref:hypothetical protein n=1 Tax=Streptomyces sp. NPDC087658 TaxID=3365800 RepID=UPI00380744E5